MRSGDGEGTRAGPGQCDRAPVPDRDLPDRAWPEGAGVSRLAKAAGYDDDTSGISALRRDIRNLEEGGWGIPNTAPPGAEGHYVLHAQDNRLALVLTPAERALLNQTLDDGQVPAPPACLDDLERAAERHCLARFSYKGKRREVHPYTVHSGPSGWVLRGRETGSDTVKSFVVSRIADGRDDRPPGIGRGRSHRPAPRFRPDALGCGPAGRRDLADPSRALDEVRRSLAGARIVDETDPETVTG